MKKMKSIKIAALFVCLSMMCGCTEIPPVSNADEPIPPDKPVYDYTVSPPAVHKANGSATSVTISFLGDCLIGTYNGFKPKGSIADALDNRPISYCFENCMNDIGNDDITIANCESVLSDKPLMPVEKGYAPAYWYRADTKNARVFSENSIDAVSIANNHTYDYGVQGLKDTKKALDDAGVAWTDEDKPLYLYKDNVCIALLSVMFGDGASMNSTINQIKYAREEMHADAVLVYVHCGRERIHTPEEWKVKQFRKLIDSGADLVVGAHPHVLQPFENYKGKHIVYSLGNFLFGDGAHFENATIVYQETFVFDKDKKLLSQNERMIPYHVYSDVRNNYRPTPVTDAKTSMDILDFMYGRKGEEVFKGIEE